MATRITINQRQIDQLFRAANGPTGQLLTSVGIRVQNSARRSVPVDTGRLRSSIVLSPPQMTGAGLAVRVGSKVNYALFVEQGTRFMRARPYLRTALR